MGVKIARGTQLQLGLLGFLALLDGDLLSLWKVILFPSHHLDKFFKIFDFLWLFKQTKQDDKNPLVK